MLRSLFRRVAPVSAASLSLLATSSIAGLEGTAESADVETPAASESTPVNLADQPQEFLGVFVQKKAAEKLRERFPAKFPTNSDDALFVVLKYQPSEEEVDAFAPLFGLQAKLTVKGYAEDDTSQALLVDVTTSSGDPIMSTSDGQVLPHILLSSLHGTSGLNSSLSHVLVERLGAQDPESKKENAENTWEGKLPVFNSQLMPLFNPFPATNAKLVNLKDEEQLDGTVCVSSTYEIDTERCGSTQSECGFCKFMKAGPCGEAFMRWEACLDRSKAQGKDFIDHCGSQTLGLRDCVDSNPEYYHVLTEDREEEKEEEKEVEKEE